MELALVSGMVSGMAAAVAAAAAAVAVSGMASASGRRRPLERWRPALAPED
jgi:hypothetical protein